MYLSFWPIRPSLNQLQSSLRQNKLDQSYQVGQITPPWFLFPVEMNGQAIVCAPVDYVLSLLIVVTPLTW